MSAAELNIRTLLLVAGGMYVLIPFSVWFALGLPRQRLPLLWCVGGFLAGVGLVLMGLRGKIDDGLSYVLGQPLMCFGNMVSKPTQDLGWIKGRGGATPYSGPEDEKAVVGQDLTVWCKQRWQYENPLWSGSGWRHA